VAQTLYADQALARDFKLGPVVTVVDAFDLESRKFSPEIARAQIAVADVIVLSKVDRASDVIGAESEVMQLNPAARRVTARFGDVDAAALLEATPRTEHAFRASPAHSSAIRSFAMQFAQAVPRALLQHFLDTLIQLRGADLLRVKGVVPLSDGQRVLVQGVRHVFDRLRPVERGEPGLVFITNGVAQSEVEALWQAMKGLS
jgi:G3E family GTPase